MGLTLQQQLAAKSLATEVALLTLLREKRDDAEFWARMDKLMAIITSLPPLKDTTDPLHQAQLEFAQRLLDSWRQIAAGDPNGPAPPGSLPFDPSPE